MPQDNTGGNSSMEGRAQQLGQTTPRIRNKDNRRRVFRTVEYYNAVTALARLFGGDIQHCILDRRVRLTHRAVVNLSQAAQGHYAFVFAELGDSIRSGDTKMVNSYVSLARHLR